MFLDRMMRPPFIFFSSLQSCQRERVNRSDGSADPYVSITSLVNATSSPAKRLGPSRWTSCPIPRYTANRDRAHPDRIAWRTAFDQSDVDEWHRRAPFGN